MGVLFFLAASGLMLNAFRKPLAIKQDDKALIEQTPSSVRPTIVASTFTSADTCAECHSEIVDQYKRSGMSHTWQSVEKGLIADFEPQTVDDTQSNFQYEVVYGVGGVVQVESRRDMPGHRLERTAEYVVGSGKHAQAMVSNENGYLTQLPVAWYTGRDCWGMNPGFELFNQRFSRPITPGCVACHATTAQHDAPSKNRYHNEIVSGIQCVRCHGDPQAHVSFWKSNPGAENPTAGTIVNPAEFSAAQSNDLCLQCHLQGDVSVPIGPGSPLALKPGDRLLDQRHDFLIRSQDSSSLGVASHGARMLQSKCYVASNGKLTCVTCHDPHKSAADIPRSDYDSRCNTCHSANACLRTKNSSSGSTAIANSKNLDSSQPADASSCTECHMPQRSSREGIHLVFTDHAIPRTRHADIGKPVVLAPNSQVQLVSCWPAALVPPRIEGAAHQLLHESMGPQTQSLEKSLEILRDVLSKNSSDTESRFWFGSALLSKKLGMEASKQFQEVLKSDSRHFLARFRLALAQEQANQIDSAITNYERLISEVASWKEPYSRLAQLYLARQQYPVANLVLQQSLQRSESSFELALMGLSYRLAGGAQAEAMKLLERSIQLDPLSPTARLHRGSLLLMDGQNESAKKEFEFVLRLDPGNSQAKQAIQQLSR